MKTTQTARQKATAPVLLGLVLAASCAALFATPSNAHAEGRKIIVEGFEASRSTMSVQLGFGGMSLSDDRLDVDGVARLGGMHLGFRWNPIDWGGLEFSVGGYSRASDDGLVYEDRGLVTLSWLWYFARHYKHRFYGITGIASSSVSASTNEGDVFHAYTEGGIVLGVGSEWLISKNWVVNADVRLLALGSDGSSNKDVDVDPEDEGIDVPETWTEIPEERTGLMMNFGIGYRW